MAIGGARSEESAMNRGSSPMASVKTGLKALFLVAGVAGTGFLTAFVLFATAYLTADCGTPGLVDELPESASDVRYVGRDNFPDWDWWLRARLPRAEFHRFAAKIGLQPHVDEDPEESWPASLDLHPFGPDWWDVGDGVRVEYSRHVKGGVVEAAGVMYYYAYSY